MLLNFLEQRAHVDLLRSAPRRTVAMPKVMAVVVQRAANPSILYKIGELTMPTRTMVRHVQAGMEIHVNQIMETALAMAAATQAT